MQLSHRAHRALSFLEEAMVRHGSAGQPLWPLAEASSKLPVRCKRMRMVGEQY